MSMSTELSEQARERLSRLIDGEGMPGDLQQLLAEGRETPRAWAATLEAWYVYHLAGDVMRSEELAGQGRDDAFLARLRERLADEPVVMAPQLPEAKPAGVPAVQEVQAVPGGQPVSVRRWRAPLAAAAGVVMVAGVVAMGGLPGRLRPGMVPAAATLAQAPAASAVAAAASAELNTLPASGLLLRDAQLDQYLAAHKQFGGSSALGVPSGFLRSATYEGPGR